MIKEYVGNVVIIAVPKKNIFKFEKWAKRLKGELVKFPGFLGIDVIRPKDENSIEYTFLIRFKNEKKLEKWQHSLELKQLIKKVETLILYKKVEFKKMGIELFLDTPKFTENYNKPSKFKLIIVGIITVYPLILVVGFLTSGLFSFLPNWLSMFLNVCIISPMIGFLLPKVTILLEGWLYSKKSFKMKPPK